MCYNRYNQVHGTDKADLRVRNVESEKIVSGSRIQVWACNYMEFFLQNIEFLVL
jgi:hypothetical protein